jgi:hypothetical protein
MNIVAKQDGQATVAKRELQNWHSGASVAEAAPQFGQLSVSACIPVILSANTGKEVGRSLLIGYPYISGPSPGTLTVL